jgi:hypothetical protein
MTNQPKPPVWAMIIGILGFCFGAFGTIAGAQDIAMPYLFSIQKQAAATVFKALEEPASPASPGSGSVAPAPENAWSTALRPFLSGPAWYPRYAMAMGIARTVLGAACMLASLLLILVRPGADFFFMLAFGLSAARNLTAVGMGIAAGSLFSFWAMASGLIGFFLNAVLLLVCLICNRSPYQPAGA